jgi:hypothetical protein
MASFPVLTMIDQRNGEGHDGLCLSVRPDAEMLEMRAQALADAYWSEHVWLTGQVSNAEFRAVYEALLAAIAPGEEKRRLAIFRLVRAIPTAAPFPVLQRVRWRVAS